MNSPNSTQMLLEMVVVLISPYLQTASARSDLLDILLGGTSLENAFDPDQNADSFTRAFVYSLHGYGILGNEPALIRLLKIIKAKADPSQHGLIEMLQSQLRQSNPAVKATKPTEAFVFISYASDDRQRLVMPLVEALQGANYKVWFDRQNIEGGTEWKKEIDEGLRRCAIVVAVLTPQSVAADRQWVRYEHQEALRLLKPIIPLVLESCSLPDYFQSIQVLEVNATPLVTFLPTLRTTIDRLLPFSGTRLADETPPASRPFVGRESDLLALYQQLRGQSDQVQTAQKAIAIQGIGGLGKTMLAEEFARRLGPRLPGGVLWQRFGEQEVDIQGVFKRWAGYKGLAPDQNLSAGEVRSILSDVGEFLVVFDDVQREHFPILLQLLEALPPQALRLLTTRNEGTDLALGAQIYALHPFSDQDAYSLFADRLKGKLEITDPSSFQTIVQLVGGHPLALELLASQCKRSTDLTNIATQLKSSMSSGDFTQLQVNIPGMGKEVNVLACLEYSYHGLLQEAPQTAALLPTLGLFANGASFSTEAISAIWGVSIAEGQQHLKQLTDYALVTALKDGRWQQHAILHNYCLYLLNELETGNSDELFAYRRVFTWRRRYFRFYGQFLQVGGPDEPLWQAALLESYHLVHGMEQAIATLNSDLIDLWSQPQAPQFPHFWQMLIHPHHPAHRWRINSDTGAIFKFFFSGSPLLGFSFGHSRSIIIRYLQTILVFIRLGQRHHRGMTQWLPVVVFFPLFLVRRRQYQRALNSIEAVTLWGLSQYHIYQQENALARHYLEVALNLAQQGTIDKADVQILKLLADLDIIDGNYELSIARLEEALSIAKHIGFNEMASVLLTKLSNLYGIEKSVETTQPLLEQALDLAQVANSHLAEAMTLAELSDDLVKSDLAQAQAYAHQALEAQIRANEPDDTENLARRGRMMVRVGQIDEGLALFEQALVIARQDDSHNEEASILLRLGMSLLEIRRYEAAREALEQGLRLAEDYPLYNEAISESAFCNQLSLVHIALYQPEQATRYLDRAAQASYHLKLPFNDAIQRQLIRLLDLDQRNDAAKQLRQLYLAKEELSSEDEPLMDICEAMWRLGLPFWLISDMTERILNLQQSWFNATSVNELQELYQNYPELCVPEIEYIIHLGIDGNTAMPPTDRQEYEAYYLQILRACRTQPVAEALQTCQTDILEFQIRMITLKLCGDPENIRHLCDRATLYHQQFQFEKAHADYEQALKLQPDDVATHLGKMALYKLQGQPEQALQLSKVLSSSEGIKQLAHEHLSTYESFIAFIYLDLLRLDEAERQIQKALALDSHNTTAYNAKGQLAFYRHDWLTSNEACQQALTLVADDYITLMMQARALSMLNRTDEALARMDQSIEIAISHQASSNFLYLFRSIIYEQRSELVQMQSDRQKALLNLTRLSIDQQELLQARLALLNGDVLASQNYYSQWVARPEKRYECGVEHIMLSFYGLVLPQRGDIQRLTKWFEEYLTTLT